MQYQELIIEERGRVLLVKLNRPKSLNAIVPNVFKELNLLIDEVKQKGYYQAVVITGEGRAFAAGADITYMSHLNSKQAKEFADEATVVLRRMEKSGLIFIAAINGYALGGGLELAMACDIRVAAKNAKFGFPETSLGIIPGWSGTQRLPRLIGFAKAKELILTCDKIDAEEAFRIGLVNKIVETETLLEDAIQMAEKISKNGPIAVSYAKEAINRGIQLDLDSAIDYEKNLFGLLFSTEDQKEGMTAFEQKRKPEFKNK